jgi:hypothetical protein
MQLPALLQSVEALVIAKIRLMQQKIHKKVRQSQNPGLAKRGLRSHYLNGVLRGKHSKKRYEASYVSFLLT